ncbi:MAG: hypothetical protein KGI06_04800 [Candidatus Micrarchaeota archaeon]|nr:hypothetical protein [Candidatus Micrarchaeota archaeon]
MEHDIRFYVIASVLILLTIASLFTLKWILIIVSLTITGLSIVFYKMYYIIEASIIKRTGIVQLIDGNELSGDRTTTVRRVKGNFIATAVAILKNNSKEPITRDKIENILENSHFTFRFIMQIEHIDVNKLLDRLQTKRSMLEIELDKLNDHVTKNNSLKINVLKRRIDQINHELDSISSGGTPLKISQYIMTSAMAANKSSAQEQAKSQLRELVSEFGALLGTSSNIMSGNELLELLKFDSMAI